jgi:hypothetical protein
MTVWLLLVGGCIGHADAVSTGPAFAGEPGARDRGPDEAAFALRPSGLRRLTRTEYDNALRDLLGDTTRSGWARLPEDAFEPFDNDAGAQVASGVLVETLEALADEAATRVFSDAARRAQLVGCAPTGPGDAACMRSFIAGFGRRALRRPLGEQEIRRYLALQSYSVEARDFYLGAALVVRALLQDPEFVYQVEIGEAVPGAPGLVRLSPFELASRLSFFLLGSPPPPALVDLAQAGRLATGADRRAAASLLLETPRAKERVSWFHAQWLRYYQLPFPAELTAALRTETDSLVQKVVFGGQDYLTLFRSPETFLTGRLARQYGLPAPEAKDGGWVGYGDDPRRGILSHGAFLAVGSKFDDTSPTIRGKFVREYLMCEDIPPPPPGVDVDQAPKGDDSPCKIDRYAEHRDVGCASCHRKIDPIGFGLEAYDRSGRPRKTDPGLPQCAIEGDGEVEGVGAFNGPGELAELLIQSGKLEPCLVRQLFRFAMARRETPQDQPTIDRLAELFARGGRRFDRLLVEMAASPAFAWRREEPAP